MKYRLSDYRVEAGVYDVGRYRIYQQHGNCWSVRCPMDSIIELFPTLRAAINYAERLIERDVARGW